MYHWIANLWHRDVHEFFIEQQIQIVLDALPDEWESVRQALIDLTQNASKVVFQAMMPVA